MIGFASIFGLIVVLVVGANLLEPVLEKMEKNQPVSKYDFGISFEEYKRLYNQSLSDNQHQYQLGESQLEQDESLSFYNVVFSETESMSVYVNKDEEVIGVSVTGNKEKYDTLEEVYRHVLSILQPDMTTKEQDDLLQNEFQASFKANEQEDVEVKGNNVRYRLLHDGKSIVLVILSK